MKTQPAMFLDRIIEVTVNGFTAPESKTYPYTISNSAGTLYAGNVYIAASATSATIDITEICRSNKPSVYPLVNDSDTGMLRWRYDNAASSKMLDTYTVSLTVSGTAYTASQLVCHATHYPFYKETTDTVLKSAASGARWWGMGGNVPALMPRFPWKQTYKYGLMFAVNGYPGTGETFRIWVNTTILESTASSQICYYWHYLQGLCSGTITGDGTVQMGINGAAYPCAKMDACPADFYVMWMDRYGGIQSQPFGKTATFSEDFTQSTVETRSGARLTGVGGKAKWSLNSGWVDDFDYPFYESLYCSPWVILYDAVNDEVYDCILKDTSYTEKTFTNQGRQLFNINLNLENSRSQKLIY